MDCRQLQFLALAFFIPLLGGCTNDPGGQTFDHTWVAEYEIVNHSSVPLVVGTSGPFHIDSGEVAAGDTLLLAAYSAFLAPEPSLDRDFWCLTLRDVSGDEVLAQYSPVSGANWSFVRPREYEVRYTFVVSDGDLVVPDALCFRLEGTLRSAADSSLVLDGGVSLDFGDLSEGQYLIGSDGSFGFWLPRDFERGELHLWSEGFGSQRFWFPHEVDLVRPGVYGGDFYFQPVRN